MHAYIYTYLIIHTYNGVARERRGRVPRGPPQTSRKQASKRERERERETKQCALACGGGGGGATALALAVWKKREGVCVCVCGIRKK